MLGELPNRLEKGKGHDMNMTEKDHGSGYDGTVQSKYCSNSFTNWLNVAKKKEHHIPSTENDNKETSAKIE